MWLVKRELTLLYKCAYFIVQCVIGNETTRLLQYSIAFQLIIGGGAVRTQPFSSPPPPAGRQKQLLLATLFQTISTIGPTREGEQEKRALAFGGTPHFPSGSPLPWTKGGPRFPHYSRSARADSSGSAPYLSGLLPTRQKKSSEEAAAGSERGN